MSKASSTPPPSRRERRAAERQDRYGAARDERRTRAAGGTGGSGSSLLSTRNLTIGAVVLGIVLVAVVAFGQLRGTSSENLIDPGIHYPAAIQDGNAVGVASAPVLMEVWGDFQCPVCARQSLDVEPSLVNEYVLANQLRIVHHEIDILGGGGDESRTPAIGAVCAVDQDQYWDYAHWIYANQQGENKGGFRRDRVIAIATAAGLDTAAFTTCLDSTTAADAFAEQQAKGAELGVNQTPTIYLNGTKYVGLKSPSDWGVLIDAELAKASASPAAPASPDGASPSASAAP